MKRLPVVGVLFVALTAGLLAYLLFAGPVLFSLFEAGTGMTPLFAVLNPLRGRGPERPANQLLRALRDGREAEVLAPLLDRREAGTAAVIMASECKSRVESWRLVDRTDKPDKIELVYNTTRAGYPDDRLRPVWIEVGRSPGDSGWHVTSYSAVY